MWKVAQNRGESAGSGRGAALPLALENGVSLKPLPKGACPVAALGESLCAGAPRRCLRGGRGRATPGVPCAPRLLQPLRTGKERRCVPSFCRVSLGKAAGTPRPVAAGAVAAGGPCGASPWPPRCWWEPRLVPRGTRLRAMPVVSREGEAELRWQWLICTWGWLVHVSSGSSVYFFKSGGLFFNQQSPFV